MPNWQGTSFWHKDLRCQGRELLTGLEGRRQKEGEREERDLLKVDNILMNWKPLSDEYGTES